MPVNLPLRHGKSAFADVNHDTHSFRQPGQVEPMTPTEQGLLGGFLVLAGGGVLWYGFNRMHKYRLIRDVPRSKIRSIALGLVEIHGLVRTDQPIKTPFSQTDCAYYRYEIKEYRRHSSTDGKGRTRTTYSWDLIASGERRVPFLAEDETGRIVVDPSEAEMDVSVKKVFLQKAGLFGGLESFFGLLRNWDENVGSDLDVASLKLTPINPKSWMSFVNRVGDRRFFEHYLEPGENLFVMGTAKSSSEPGNALLVSKGENEPTFLVSNKTEEELLSSLKWMMIACYGGAVIGIAIGAVLLLRLAHAI
jgi:hypothetical protein